MTWAAVAAGAAAVAGSVVSSKSAKKSSKKASQGSERELDLIRESRDLARADQQPWRQSGVTALNALMSMTGLSGSGGGVRRDANGWPVENTGGPLIGPTNNDPIPLEDPRFQGKVMRGSRFGSSFVGRADGGPMYPDTIYNINEMGPESVYANGAYTRNSNPATIDGETGYVEPNIEGRGLGGFLKKALNPFKNPKEGLAGAVGLGVSPILGMAIHKGKEPLTKKLFGGRGGNTVKVDAPFGAAQTDVDTTQGLDYNFKTDPGYKFRFEEGQRALERGAAARGGLLSGGLARKSIRYGQDYASGEYNNVYNRIANIAGLGQTATNYSGNYAINAGQGMGTAAAQGAYASAYGDLAGGNAIAGGINQLSQIDWESILNRGSSVGYGSKWTGP